MIKGKITWVCDMLHAHENLPFGRIIERIHLGDVGVDGRTVLKWVFQTHGVNMRIGIRSNRGFL
jgi:hypothetical protein